MDDAEQQDAADSEATSQAGIEAEARKMGWLPESEWMGAPPKYGFVDAQTFLERGETILPILKANLA